MALASLSLAQAGPPSCLRAHMKREDLSTHNCGGRGYSDEHAVRVLQDKNSEISKRRAWKYEQTVPSI
eukprot:272683-Pleurochrysis_carterae.AAC.2